MKVFLNTVSLFWRDRWSRPLAAGLNLLLLTLRLASSTLQLVIHQINSAFERDLAGIGVVVGPRAARCR